MGKNATLFIVIAMMITFLALPAYAEVQNIKISGDVTVRSVVRDNYDLDKDDGGGAGEGDMDNYFMHSMGLNVLADLTDNVGATVRMTNQRDWDNNSSGAATFDVDLDLAYVTLKEALYAPLTLTIGRQDIWLGNGFIIGAKLLDFNASLAADEYTEASAFDAIRATLDYDPWTIDLIYAKMDENVVGADDDDVDLYVANAGYKLEDSYNTMVEGYFVAKVDDGQQLQAFPTAATLSTVEANRVYTTGARATLDPKSNITLSGELAYQFGKYSQVINNTRDRDAYALDLMAEYRWPANEWKPKLSLEYIAYSGEEDDADGSNGEWNAWDPVFRGKFDTAIREFQNYYYATSYRCTNAGSTEVDMDSGLTNQRQLLITGTIYPLKQVTMQGTLAHFWFDESPMVGEKSKNVGNELDFLLTYDYSQDLSFNLLTAYFMPGSYWAEDQNDNAIDIVGSMKLTF